MLRGISEIKWKVAKTPTPAGFEPGTIPCLPDTSDPRLSVAEVLRSLPRKEEVAGSNPAEEETFAIAHSISFLQRMVASV